ncbi:Atu4866 domain-containing protein [Rhizobium pusense]|nr:Atu4866 domain-containing protein [Agrobacterium pusense]
MRRRLERRVVTAASILGAALLLLAVGPAYPQASQDKEPRMLNQPHPYVGMWVTEDGYIRHELLPNGRYDEARGSRKSAYQGRYVVTGDHIDYVDDTGFTADGDFRDDVLYHAGMVLRRER